MRQLLTSWRRILAGASWLRPASVRQTGRGLVGYQPSPIPDISTKQLDFAKLGHGLKLFLDGVRSVALGRTSLELPVPPTKRRPQPGTLALLGLGLAGPGSFARRKY